jgi:hypothetical protein
VPLIHAIYGDDPNVGIYTLLILIWYPMQLVVGSILVPWLEKLAEQEKEWLGSADTDSVLQRMMKKKPQKFHAQRRKLLY